MSCFPTYSAFIPTKDNRRLYNRPPLAPLVAGVLGILGHYECRRTFFTDYGVSALIKSEKNSRDLIETRTYIAFLYIYTYQAKFSSIPVSRLWRVHASKAVFVE